MNEEQEQRFNRINVKCAIRLVLGGWMYDDLDNSFDIEALPFLLREMADDYDIEIKKVNKEEEDSHV